MLFLQHQFVNTGQLEFGHIPVHPGDDLLIVFIGDFRIVHIPAGKLFCQDFVKDHIFIIGDGFVDAALRIGAGRDYGTVPGLGQG